MTGRRAAPARRHPRPRADACGCTQFTDLLTMLYSAQRLDDVAAVPGSRLEALAGDRAGEHSIRVNHAVASVVMFGTGAAS